MRIDLHNHTILCHHASGSIEQYIARAKELGIDVYGFSCHAPMNFDEQYRMSFSELESYIKEIHSYAKKEREQGEQTHQKHIEILCGLEVDFIDGREDLLDSRVFGAKLDYLIGSVHFLGEWGFDNPEFIGEYAKRDMTQCWSAYLASIQKMAESRAFNIVGHFDLLKIFNHKMPSALKLNLKHTLESIAESKMSIELNSAGLRKQIGEIYPSKEILEQAFKLGIPITFGSDAHALNQVGAGYEECIKVAKEVGYKQCVYYKEKSPIFVEF